jgi:hypothetical protein
MEFKDVKIEEKKTVYVTEEDILKSLGFDIEKWRITEVDTRYRGSKVVMFELVERENIGICEGTACSNTCIPSPN